MSQEDKTAKKRSLQSVEAYKKAIEKSGIKEAEAAFAYIKEEFEQVKQARKEKIKIGEQSLSNAFAFVEQAFGQSQEMAIFLTNLSSHAFIMKFIRENDCEEYYKYQELLFMDKKQQQILTEIDKIQKILDLS